MALLSSHTHIKAFYVSSYCMCQHSCLRDHNTAVTPKHVAVSTAGVMLFKVLASYAKPNVHIKVLLNSHTSSKQHMLILEFAQEEMRHDATRCDTSAALLAHANPAYTSSYEPTCAAVDPEMRELLYHQPPPKQNRAEEQVRLPVSAA